MSFLLLMIVFRSILVPLKAALMNLLSIAAAYGVLVAVFQWGWGNGLIGLHSTMPINPFLPLIMFAILFGLSMDYEVFLLSRIREEYVATGDNHEAVVRGLSSTARVITSAALIMISVFGAFVLGDDPNGKLFGVGLAVAVLLDATLVRMVLVPGDDEPARPGQLVAPGLARPHPSAPRPRGRTEAHTETSTPSPSASSPPPEPSSGRLYRPAASPSLHPSNAFTKENSNDHVHDLSRQLDLTAEHRLARWRPLVQWLLAIPHLAVAYVLTTLRHLLTAVSFVTVLFTKRIPRPVYDAIAMTYRYEWRSVS